MQEQFNEQNASVEENLDVPIVSFAESIISKTIEESNVQPERMTRNEKMEIIWKLSDQGIPRMKGAISEIARQLKISESTVYRYISMKQ
jgi:predicted transcriptional regulator YheO